MKGSRSIIGTAIALGLLAGSTVGVTAQEEDPTTSPPVEFTGHIVCGPEVQAGTREVVPPAGEVAGHVEERGFAWRPVVTEMSDPRMEGTYHLSWNGDNYPSGVTVGSGTWRIENEAGAWQGDFTKADYPDHPTTVSSALAGEGAYAGLTAIWESVLNPNCTWDVRGLIIEGEPPAVPEPYVPAAAEHDATTTAVDDASLPDEATVTDVAELDDRTVDLTIASPSVGEAKVRLLLPASFDEEPEATYPVLYLLHGAEDDYTSWTRETDVEDLTADLDLLVVMPEAGRDGWYTDWWNGAEGGVPAWETFHLSEVRDIIERDWRASDERVIAGLSMGGYGTMHYATAHPELFRAAAAFSGVLDPVGADFGFGYVLWGDREEQAENWAAHDPVAMAENLAGKPLYVSWQDGQPGPLDPPGTTADSYDLEAWVALQNEAFVARLEELGIPVTVETGAGAHEWPYWEQGLHDALPMLLEALEE